MFIKTVRKRCLAASLAAFLVLGTTGCRNTNAELLSWPGGSMAAPVQTLSIQGKNKAETYAGNVCVIPKKKAKGKEGVSFLSSAQLCVNVTEQKAVYANQIYEHLYPASVTKLFSAFVILKYGNLEDMVTVSAEAANITEPGAKLCGMKEGEQYSLRSLLEIMLIYSANDAALAAAEHVGGSVEHFVEMMNDLAVSIGAVDSHFMNPHGLHDDEHYTTAYDIYLILNELVKNQEFVEMIHKDKCEITFLDVDGVEKSMSCTSTNGFLLGTQAAPQGLTIIGGKTGTTLAAGSCLAIYSKGDSGNEYISVILKAGNSQSVFSQMAQLLSMCGEK